MIEQLRILVLRGKSLAAITSHAGTENIFPRILNHGGIENPEVIKSGSNARRRSRIPVSAQRCAPKKLWLCSYAPLALRIRALPPHCGRHAIWAPNDFSPCDLRVLCVSVVLVPLLKIYDGGTENPGPIFLLKQKPVGLLHRENQT